MKKPSVAVAMSGGVDSSVAAALLVQSGYRVVGFTLLLWDGEGDTKRDASRFIRKNVLDAERVCEIIGASHYTVDMRDDFRREVADPFDREYLAGRTPNPCVICNARIKWRLLREKAQALGLDRLATGHYARIKHGGNNAVQLLKGLDLQKDQSYFLWHVPVDLLRLTLLPLGDKHKHDLRAIARELNLPVVEKNESQEICFIPDDDYRAYLRENHPDLEDGKLSGEIVDSTGKVLGLHSGYYLFTIGQRKGLGIGGGRKLYVTGIDPKTHRVMVGDENDLIRKEFKVGMLNSFDEELYKSPSGIDVKIRYRDPGVPATLKQTDIDSVTVYTMEPVKAVAPGQSAVFYRGDQVLGGGIILSD